MMYWPMAKVISFKDISTFALVAELNILINFCRRHHKEHFLLIYFEFRPLVQVERPFKDLSGGLFFSASRPFVQL